MKQSIKVGKLYRVKSVFAAVTETKGVVYADPARDIVCVISLSDPFIKLQSTWIGFLLIHNSSNGIICAAPKAQFVASVLAI